MADFSQTALIIFYLFCRMVSFFVVDKYRFYLTFSLPDLTLYLLILDLPQFSFIIGFDIVLCKKHRMMESFLKILDSN